MPQAINIEAPTIVKRYLSINTTTGFTPQTLRCRSRVDFGDFFDEQGYID
jgi:hypothetical protein